VLQTLVNFIVEYMPISDRILTGNYDDSNENDTSVSDLVGFFDSFEEKVEMF
ncbi:hypothetical protein CHUAL_011287, partial [Chamberlinius hualienensis]